MYFKQVEPECRMKKANSTANTVNVLNKKVRNAIGHHPDESQNDYRTFGNIERNTIDTDRTVKPSKRMSRYNNINKVKSRSDNRNISSISNTTIISEASNTSESMNLNNRTFDVLINNTFYDEFTNSTTLYKELNRTIDVGRSFKSINNRDKLNTSHESMLSEWNSTTEESFNDSLGPETAGSVQNVTEDTVFRDSFLKYDAVASSLTVSLRFVAADYDDDYYDDLNDIDESELEETSTVKSDINNNSDKSNTSLIGKKINLTVSSNISNFSSDDAEPLINNTRTIQEIDETKSQIKIPDTNSSMDTNNNISMSSSSFRKHNSSKTDPIFVSPKFHHVANKNKEEGVKKTSFLSRIYNNMFGVSKEEIHLHSTADITTAHPNYHELSQDTDEEGSGDI